MLNGYLASAHGIAALCILVDPEKTIAGSILRIEARLQRSNVMLKSGFRRLRLFRLKRDGAR